MQTCLIGAPHRAAISLSESLGADCQHHQEMTFDGLQADAIDCLIYFAMHRGNGLFPNQEDAGALLLKCQELKPKRVILLSSSLVFPAKHQHPSMVPETKIPSRRRSVLADAWGDLERQFKEKLRDVSKLAILRSVPVIDREYGDFFSTFFKSGLALTLVGHDPNLQFLKPAAFERGVKALVDADHEGVFHLAADDVITLKKALQLAGVFRLPSPYWLNVVKRKLGASLGLMAPMSVFERLRYHWTIDDSQTRKVLGLKSLGRSGEAILAVAGRPLDTPIPVCDRFGMDEDYIRFKNKTAFGFMHDHYFRVEYKGLEHLPKQGRALMVGVHRGFMPIDGPMSMLTVLRVTGRHLRYLVHHSLVKPPGLFNFTTKLGGVIGDDANGDYLLQNEELVGIFPEGIQGAFTYYKDAYKLGRFGRDAYVRLAIRNQAPLIPFATVGSAEIYPIVGRIDMDWFKRFTEWPFLPITTPIPMPSKWHTVILEPINIPELYPPEAAEDRALVRQIGRDVEARLQAAIDEMRQKRKRIFWGTIFD